MDGAIPGRVSVAAQVKGDVIREWSEEVLVGDHLAVSIYILHTLWGHEEEYDELPIGNGGLIVLLYWFWWAITICIWYSGSSCGGRAMSRWLSVGGDVGSGSSLISS